MKPVLEHLPIHADESFVVKYFDYAYYPTPWHFHPEFEMVLVTESTGKRFIGDHICGFGPGNLALIGPNLPHLYRNDAQFYEEGSKLRAKSIVVHFSEEIFSHLFPVMPETKSLKDLFRKSRKGLEITGACNQRVTALLLEMVTLKGLSRLIKLLEALNVIAESNECSFICGAGTAGVNEKESKRMDDVLNYLTKNFAKDISRSDVAKVANMSENAFSRYFSQRTRKTFSSYLNDLRLGHACTMLIVGEKNISRICTECGFNNISNFNRQFKMLYGVSPFSYSKAYWKHSV